MLLLDEAAAEERVRRRLHAPAPTQADIGAYDDGYEDDSAASFVARSAVGRGPGEHDGPPRLRVLPEDRTERMEESPRPREERSSGRLLGGLRQRLQQIEQEDFSGGALDGEPRAGLLRSPLLRAAAPRTAPARPLARCARAALPARWTAPACARSRAGRGTR
jgi:hypothetical protein